MVSRPINYNQVIMIYVTEAMDWSVLLLIPLILMVATGNVLVIISVWLDRRLRSSTNYFLTSLAVADLLVAVVVMPPSLAMIVNNYVWPFPPQLCGVWTMLDVFFSTASILHLCLISLDRYVALSRPFSHRRSESSLVGRIKLGSYEKPRVTRSIGIRIFIVWATAFVIAVPLPILGASDRDNLFIGDMCAINVPEFAVFGSLVAFLLPLVIMFVMYTLTILALRRQAKLITNAMTQSSDETMNPNHGKYSSVREAINQIQTLLGFGVVIQPDGVKPMTSHASTKRIYRSKNSTRRLSSSFKHRIMANINNEQRASKVIMTIRGYDVTSTYLQVLGLIFVLFCLFWSPFFITNVVSHLCQTCNQQLMGQCMNWFVWVGYVSSGVNPCVYTLFSRRFRQTFLNILRGRCLRVNQLQRGGLRSSCEATGGSVKSVQEPTMTSRNVNKVWRTGS
uniref:5-hydroxytryptamine receptor 2C-like isoform X2 n=1 Tax=Ciona intestinalis TaxID=7719 RepID=UPI00089DBDD6|nr:5-hydroxytryptamine receptor 2C-like isoform X2 [Ciona intestinalis]|eukprot:XP_018671402.1 5-hydroxytryptamine receptor 2C-like isoform X2 [Ciona intestinalis]